MLSQDELNKGNKLVSFVGENDIHPFMLLSLAVKLLGMEVYVRNEEDTLDVVKGFLVGDDEWAAEVRESYMPELQVVGKGEDKDE